MNEMPSTACCISGLPVIYQQRVLLFGSVRCTDLDKSQLDQGFRHGRAQMYRQHHKQLDQKLSDQSNQRNSYQDSYYPSNWVDDSIDNSNNYFTNLGGGTSSQTSDGRSIGIALFGEGLYDETI